MHFIAQKLLSGRGMGASKYKYSTGALIAHTIFAARPAKFLRVGIGRSSGFPALITRAVC